ncbi:MAG: methylmalonyl Co-A mutase-associated GTPase MeaB [Acidobacteriota bacterium]|nr:methylmalonyl Co-A mutase-associated GTPase MeaB [Acidobacteriota bacterium]
MGGASEARRAGGTGPSLADRLLGGHVGALARGISLVESGHDGAVKLLRDVYPRTGRAITVGITGFPGAGKSSLVDRLISGYRARGQTVGVIAVDPSSAFSGGAILGDRVRMMRHTGDDGVFIRSMATRGNLGGLARATGEAVDLVDAAGIDVILIETVGVGQDEIDVASLADVVVVVLVPGMGDDIQAIKAGILEIADLFVVNKSDREGADKLVAELRQMMTLSESRGDRRPILKTVATQGLGIDELARGIEEHLSRPETAERRDERRRERAGARLRELLADALLSRTLDAAGGAEAWVAMVGRLADREIDPYSAVEELLTAGEGAR